MKNRTWLIPTLIIGFSAAVLACLCLFFTGFFGWVLYRMDQPTTGDNPQGFFRPTSTPVVIRPPQETPPSGPVSPTEQSTVPRGDGNPLEKIVPGDTLKALEESEVPINDLRDLARRLEGKENIPLTVNPPAGPLSIGTTQDFWVANVDTNENFRISAVLRYITDHVYFWVQTGVSYDEAELSALAETFENDIYPTNRDFFGSEWNPGVDGDPHLYILYAEGLGTNLAGYFSSADENHPLAHEYSNAREMFLLNADNINLAEEFTYGVLAHEFQHMIHWHGDRNEASWLNEGFSELAAFINGFDLGGFDYSYTEAPDLQLNDWPNDPSDTSPHYGAGFLFLNYFLSRFGEEATQSLVAHPENGLESIDEVLSEIDALDPLTGRRVTADDVFQDWVLTSYLQDAEIADGRYIYTNYPEAPQPEETEVIDDCGAGPFTWDVHQYGVDYLRITCPGEYTLRFEGSIQVGLLPVGAYSGDYAFWSNKGDESDMTLTQEFDFTGQEGPLTLTYWTWYDLEADYDYLYLEASLDGQRWDILNTPSGTLEDPSGNSYGWGYNGESAGWIQESVDLSRYSGQKVQIRFEYITDAAVNGEGFLLDDVAIPETGYFNDFEQDQGGWRADGWVRVQNILPQTYRLALITRGDTTTVDTIALEPDFSASIPFQIGGEVEEVILVVSGTTRFTRQKAGYRIEILP